MENSEQIKPRNLLADNPHAKPVVNKKNRKAFTGLYRLGNDCFLIQVKESYEQFTVGYQEILTCTLGEAIKALFSIRHACRAKAKKKRAEWSYRHFLEIRKAYFQPTNDIFNAARRVNPTAMTACACGRPITQEESDSYNHCCGHCFYKKHGGQ